MRHHFTFEPNASQQGILNLNHLSSRLGHARTALVMASLFLAMLFVGTGHAQAQAPQAGNVSTDNSPNKANALLNKANERVLFMENRGQVLDQHSRARPDVLFVAKSGRLKVALRANGISYQFEKAHYKAAGKSEKKAAPHGPDADVREIEKVESHRLDMHLEGANPAPEVIREAGSDYTENYFNIAAAPQGITGVKSFTRIRMKEVYPGIDWVIYAQGGQMKYDFIVQPGANPAQIRMRYAGSADLRIERSGALTVKTPLGDISEQAPVSYQDGREIPSRFVLDGSVLSLAFTGYDPSRTLTVDPLVWATYYGGTGADQGYATAVDGSGNVYLAGATGSSTGIASGGHQNTFLGGDAFLVKFDASGTRLWATYYGGGDNFDEGNSIATDGSGNVFLAGTTGSTTAGIASGGHQNANGGSIDAFLVKFDASGIRLWGTYYGGTGNDYCASAATDGSGNVYLAGETGSSTGIASGGHQNTIGGGTDAFLVKFNASGTRQWATYYGGTADDRGRSAATDGSGNVYLTGFTESSSGIASGGYQNTYGGSGDFFLVKFNASGTRQWATYYGGEGYDDSGKMAIDGSGNLYLAGSTGSTTGIASGGHQNTTGGNFDAFLAKFDASGTRLWATYYGGENNDFGSSTATDGSGNVYLAGATLSYTGIASGGHQNTFAGPFNKYDGFLVKFNASGTRQWATYYGGTDDDQGRSTATDGSGNVYLAGFTRSSADIASGGHQNALGGSDDAFLAKLCTGPSGLTYSSTPASYCVGTAITANTPSNAGSVPTSYSVSPALPAGLSLNPSTGEITGTATAAAAAANYTVTASNDCGLTTVAVNITVRQGPSSLTYSSNPASYCVNTAITANNPTISGTAPFTYSVSPALPSGLSLSTTTGAITGTPTAAAAAANYTVTATNDCGSTTVAVNIVVNTAPSFTTCPGAPVTANTPTGLCTATVSYSVAATGTPAPTLSYAFTGTTTGTGSGTGSGSTFNKGNTTVTVTATNTCGTPTCVFTVTVNDNQAPSITCPSNIVRSNDAGQCYAVVNYATPTATDNCGTATVTLTSAANTASGSQFPAGVTTSVTWQASDNATPSPNVKSCTFTIKVNDTQQPSIACPSNITKGTDPGLCTAVTDYATPTFSDNCSGSFVSIVSGPSSGQPFQKGPTTVQWKATDAAGLTKTCTFRVTVNDNQLPTISCPASQSLNTDANLCSAVATYDTPTAADNCTPAPTVVKTSGLASGSTFPKGPSTVVWKATDGVGLIKTCSFTVTVTDNQAPGITCPGNISVTGSGSPCKATVSYATPTATDNCTLQSVFLLSGLGSGSQFPAGTSPVVWQAIDNSGGSQTCAFTVMVSCGSASEQGGVSREQFEVLTTDSRQLITMHLAPNPATTQVQISVENLGENGGVLSVFDAMGRTVWQQRIGSETLTSATSEQTRISLDDHWKAGVYMVVLHTDGQTVTKRLVVSRL